MKKLRIDTAFIHPAIKHCAYPTRHCGLDPHRVYRGDSQSPCKSSGIYITALILLTLCGCSIFDLKTAPPPLTGVKTEDPLNIGDILSVVSESAVDMEYSDYFANGAVFEYSHFQKISGKGEIINMLNRLRTQTSLVEWRPEKADKRFEGNLQIAENMPYTVYSGGKVICTGLADFHIVREPDWMINYWKDVPDGGYMPFFEP